VRAKSPIVLETPRLVLREIEERDLDFLTSLHQDAEVMRYFPRLYSRDETAAITVRVRASYAANGYGLWLVEDRVTGAPLGRIGLIRQLIWGRPEVEVGYMVARHAWRRGLATEAARACRDHAVLELGAPRVISLIRPDNLPSRRVAANLGMHVEQACIHGGMLHWLHSVGPAEQL
jgi:ribosomal-protein-alanine N-acetyltransferase